VLVHVSSEYVFDGMHEGPHPEDWPANPLSVYGRSKADGDTHAGHVTKHYLIRTTWVAGEGGNFVRTMAGLADRGVSPTVVDDQIGRLTFTEDIAAAIVHLLGSSAAYGTYNVSNSGEPQSWADIAADVYALCGRERGDVTGVSTAEYFAGKEAAPRPLQSTLDLAKLTATGFVPATSASRLNSYVQELTA
jgi:dTDP-4-dehydrorhamnose reductase